MNDYRVIIAGCRNFYNYVTLKERCEYYLQNKIKTHNVIIVSGHASGADSLGEKFAADSNVNCTPLTGISMARQPDQSEMQRWQKLRMH